MKDYLGSEINVGDRGVRVHSYSHTKEFKKITVEKIDTSREFGDTIGVITDGNSKIGWTYPSRIIVQSSLSVII